MVTLSVVIITFNEEANIARCINSVKSIADEIVVVDSYSVDRTAQIARELGAKVYFQTFLGHIEQKNFAISKASNKYILSLDADEALSDGLKASILEAKKNWIYDGYEINRLNNYCGKWIRHGAWYPDRKLRLWDSSKGKWAGMNPHDKFQMSADAKIKKIKGDILHYSFKSIDEHRNKSMNYAEIGARAYHKRGKKYSIFKLLINPVNRFIRDYLFKLGFLDGYYGWIIALINAKEVYLKYRWLKKLYGQSNS